MYQKTIIVGNLGNDPEMRYTASGVPVTSFSVAVNERWTDKDGQRQEKTTWFRVTAWKGLAENCARYLYKGARVLVEGTVSASAWMGNDGEPRAALELTARTVQFLSPKAEGEAEADGSEVGEDLPF